MSFNGPPRPPRASNAVEEAVVDKDIEKSLRETHDFDAYLAVRRAEGLDDSAIALGLIQYGKDLEVTHKDSDDEILEIVGNRYREAFNQLKNLDSTVVTAFVEWNNVGFITQHLDSFDLTDPNAILRQLCTIGSSAANGGYAATEFIKKYPGKLDEEALDILLDSDRSYGVMRHLEKFDGISAKDIFKKIAYKKPEKLAGELGSFSDEDRDSAAEVLLKDRYIASNMVGNLKYFSGDIQKKIIEAALNQPVMVDYHIVNLIEQIDLIPNVDDQEQILIQVASPGWRRGYKALLDSAKKFSSELQGRIAYYVYLKGSHEEKTQLSEMLTELEGVSSEEALSLISSVENSERYLIPVLDKFPNVDANEVILEALKRPNSMAKEILKKLPDIKNLKREEIVAALVTNIGIETVAKGLDSLQDLSNETRQTLVTSLLGSEMAEAIKLNGSVTPPVIESLAKFSSIVGSFPSKDLYNLYMNSGQDEVYFKERVELARKSLFEGDIESLRASLSDPVMVGVLKSQTRFETSQWGSSDTSSFISTTERYLDGRDTYAPLPEGYEKGSIQVAKQSKPRQGEGHTYSPEFMERWKTLIPSLNEAEACLSQPEKLVDLYSRFSQAIEQEKAEIVEALERAPNEHAKSNLQKRQAVLDSVSVNSIEEMSDAFEKLYDRKKRPELAEVSRVFGFYAAMKMNPGQSFDDVDATSPSPADISKVLEFTQHVTHQETWENNEFFASKAAQDGLDSLFHVKALEDEIGRMRAETGVSTKSQSIDIIPSRDLLTELSGHMGDACWASRQEILKDNPNISSLTFLIKGEVAGASLLIDTVNDEGEPLTVIRGLNPLERVINKLDSESFVNELRSYLTQIAERRGRKLAIVVDDHQGGSATNRPFLFAYLSGLRHSLTKVRGIQNEDTKFNGYDITSDVYYLPEPAAQ